MATQEPMREDDFPEGAHAQGYGRVERASVRDDDRAGDSADQASDAETGEYADNDIEFEEVLLPDSFRDSLSELTEALRNVVRCQPLAVVAAAAGVAYLLGHRASRR